MRRLVCLLACVITAMAWGDGWTRFKSSATGMVLSVPGPVVSQQWPANHSVFDVSADIFSSTGDGCKCVAARCLFPGQGEKANNDLIAANIQHGYLMSLGGKLDSHTSVAVGSVPGQLFILDKDKDKVMFWIGRRSDGMFLLSLQTPKPRFDKLQRQFLAGSFILPRMGVTHMGFGFERRGRN